MSIEDGIEDPIENNDRRFERELRHFVPLEVDLLPMRANVTQRWFTAAIATAALLILGIIGMLLRSHNIASRVALSNIPIPASQIMLGDSHAALLRAASFDAAIDQLEREERLKKTKTTQGKHSAFEVLGRDYAKTNF